MHVCMFQRTVMNTEVLYVIEIQYQDMSGATSKFDIQPYYFFKMNIF